MMNLLRKVWRWVRGCFSKRERPFRTWIVDDVPETLAKNVVYVVGENGHYWSVVLLCPCGCRAVIQLNLVEGVSPRWIFEVEVDESLTLQPSVWRTEGCRSHFFLREGKVQWCLAQVA